MQVSFQDGQSLRDFQEVVDQIYGEPDDRLYSITDILTQQQRFTMRALKGVRKNDQAKILTNLLIALAWSMAVANRLHVDLQAVVWKRFPGLCSYCGKRPCTCRVTKPTIRKPIKAAPLPSSFSLADAQTMFEAIYPSTRRSSHEAGVHLAEEMGEVSEAVHNYLGQHQKKLFEEIAAEIADYLSCVFGLANSAGIDVSQELAKLFSNNCHVCHKAPCECSFSSIALLKS